MNTGKESCFLQELPTPLSAAFFWLTPWMPDFDQQWDHKFNTVHCSRHYLLSKIHSHYRICVSHCKILEIKMSFRGFSHLKLCR